MKRFLEKFREKRTVYFQSWGQFFLRLGITANIMTVISLLAGLGAVYFLFENNLLFIILGILHLIADGLDGVLARLSTPTKFGEYFDYGTDRTITFLALIKIAWFINPYAYLVALLFLLTNIFYITADLKSPILFTRTIMIGLLILQLPSLAYIIVGIVSVYSLAVQVQWFVERRRNKINKKNV